jgi:hypothetical protein
MKVRRTFVAVATLLIPFAVSVPVTAMTPSDITPPILTTPGTPKFLTGYQIAPGGPHWGCNGERDGDGIVEAPVKVHWSAYDPSTPITYKLRAADEDGGVTTIFRHSTRTSYRSYANNADQSCGGGNFDWYAYYLRARDAAGNSVRNTIYNAGELTVTEQDGQPWGMHDYGPSPTITYSSHWNTSTCTCYHNYDAMKTKTQGATATFQLQDTTDGQSHMAFVMSVGPHRGSFDIYVGGVFKKTVSTYAPVSEDRIVVANVSVSYNPNIGIPPVTIVNRATPGHPKLTLDAVLTN